MRHGLVEGKVALVTGAGSGLGRATALKFMKKGAMVIVADYDVKGGGETLRMIREAGGEGIFIMADVTINNDVQTMVKEAVEVYGRLDCSHNNAGGIGSQKFMKNITEEEFERNIDINLKGTWYCMRAEIAQILKQGGGAIVNTASAAGLMGYRLGSDYVSTKHAVVGLTKAVALDYATRGVRVNCIYPGITNTPRITYSKGGERLAAILASMQPPTG